MPIEKTEQTPWGTKTTHKYTMDEIIMNVVHEAKFHKNEGRDVQYPIPKWELQGRNTRYGWLGVSGGRRARALAARGELQVSYIKGYAHYSIPTDVRQGRLFDEDYK
jgi:hypothetical protein